MANSQSPELPQLTKDVAIQSLRDFFRDKPLVIFGTGMSCALDPRFGMPALKDELVQKVALRPPTPEHNREWLGVKRSLQGGDDLETALNSVTESSLLEEITEVTGRFISSLDREHGLRIAEGAVTWPATGFFERLVHTLPEGDRTLHVLTPNYDTLFENACDMVGIQYTTGFYGGQTRRLDWEAVNNSLTFRQSSPFRRTVKSVYKYRKHVRLYKVHGSLNFFFHHNEIVENNSWMWDAPHFSKRVMITPGLLKYKTLQSYRRELLERADTAINKASRFLFLGYGFNDHHLEIYIKNKIISQGCKGLILTKESNSRIESLVADADNLWLVCSMRECYAGKGGTRIYNSRYANSLNLPAKEIWKIDSFNTEILGG